MTAASTAIETVDHTGDTDRNVNWATMCNPINTAEVIRDHDFPAMSAAASTMRSTLKMMWIHPHVCDVERHQPALVDHEEIIFEQRHESHDETEQSVDEHEDRAERDPASPPRARGRRV